MTSQIQKQQPQFRELFYYLRKALAHHAHCTPHLVLYLMFLTTTTITTIHHQQLAATSRTTTTTAQTTAQQQAKLSQPCHSLRIEQQQKHFFFYFH